MSGVHGRKVLQELADVRRRWRSSVLAIVDPAHRQRGRDVADGLGYTAAQPADGVGDVVEEFTTISEVVFISPVGICSIVPELADIRIRLELIHRDL